MPLAGAAGGLLFGILFGSVTTRRAGTIFALISLGVGELVYAATFMLPGYLRRRGGHHRQPHARAGSCSASISARSFSVYYLIASWALVAAIADARASCARPRDACATRSATIRSARQFIGYRHAARALHRVRGRRPVRRVWRAACTRSTTRSSRPTPSARSAPARCC